MRKRTLYFVSFLLIFLFNCIELQAKDEIPGSPKQIVVKYLSDFSMSHYNNV